MYYVPYVCTMFTMYVLCSLCMYYVHYVCTMYVLCMYIKLHINVEEVFDKANVKTRPSSQAMIIFMFKE